MAIATRIPDQCRPEIRSVRFVDRGRTFHALWCGQLDLSRHADPGHHLDEYPAAVELPPCQAVASRSRKRVMVVVPSLTQCQHAHDRIVSAVIMAFIGLAAPDVADRVHTPCDMMFEEDPNESPQRNPVKAPNHVPLITPPRTAGMIRLSSHPEGEEITDDLEILVGFQIGDVPILIRLFRSEQPA